MSEHTIASLYAAARQVQKNAYAPYSHFQVGAALYTKTGHLYVGCNVENVSYGVTQCAENSAVGAMASAGEYTIAEILIIGSGKEICAPCGRCRQIILEFGEPTTLIHMSDQNGKIATKTLETLMPFSFSKRHLAN